MLLAVHRPSLLGDAPMLLRKEILVKKFSRYRFLCSGRPDVASSLRVIDHLYFNSAPSFLIFSADAERAQWTFISLLHSVYASVCILVFLAIAEREKPRSSS